MSQPVHRRSDLKASLLEATGRAAGTAFSVVSRARGAKSLHPKGAVYEGVLRIDGVRGAPPASLLEEPAERNALVRFSRSIGLPRRVPDLFGISVRLPDAYGPDRHQDILTVTSVDAPVLHHVFVPVTDPQQAPYSSSLPYRAGGGLFLLGFAPVPDSPRPAGATLDERLENAAATGALRFSLVVSAVFGRFYPVGELRIGRRLPDELEGLRFNPWNTGGGLEPAGFFNRLRAYAYPASQEGWTG